MLLTVSTPKEIPLSNTTLKDACGSTCTQDELKKHSTILLISMQGEPLKISSPTLLPNPHSRELPNLSPQL
jgi:hypothetical protein